MEERLMKCNRCGKKQPVNNMRYLQSIKNMMCLDCINKIKSPKTEMKKEEGSNDKLRFKCQKCKHKFMLKEKYNKQCPFCGGFDLISQEWNSDLDALIDDSTQKIYDN